jgi:hypothetical protein
VRAGPGLALALWLVCGCTSTIVPKSRIEAQERAAVLLQGETAFDLDLPGNALDTDELSARFVADVTRELGRRRSVAPNRDRADAVLALQLVSVSLAQQPGDFLALHISAAARVEGGGEKAGQVRSPWRASEYESSARPSAEWSAASGKLLEDEIATGFTAVAIELVGSTIRAKQEEKK